MQSQLSPEAQLKIVYRNVSTLKPYEDNAKQHPKNQVRKIARSMQQFGWTNPLIITADGTILCGHGRYEAARSLGIRDAPTIVLEHLSEADRRAYIIADNVLAEQSGWSKEMLKKNLQGLEEIGYELELTGLDTLKIDSILNMDDSTVDADDEVELPADDLTGPH